VAGNLLEGGQFGSLLGGPAALIVLGGTIGAGIVQFPLETCAAAVKALGPLLKKSAVSPAKLVDEIVGYADRARRDGIDRDVELRRRARDDDVRVR